MISPQPVAPNIYFALFRNKEMKFLIPYDGTKAAENALLELRNLEFSKTDEILIVITDVFLPESAEEFFKAKKERRLNLEKSGTHSFAPARRRFEEERFLSRQIRRRLSSDFPNRNIRIETLPNFSLVSSEILAEVAREKPDLIILGLQENKNDTANDGYKSGLWRVAAEAACPVRFARGNDHKTAVSKDVAETSRQKKMDAGKMFRSAEKIKSLPTIVSRRRYKPQREIGKLAAVASF